VTTFGFPHTIKIDNRKEVVNKLIEYICELSFIVAQKLVKSVKSAEGDD
jgi:hypothetical protein